MEARNESELGKALRNNDETIELHGDLARRIRKLKALSHVLWCICMSLLAITISAVLLSPAAPGVSAVAGLVAGTPAAGILGVPTAVTAVLTAVSGGGTAVLSKLRNYRMTVLTENHIILNRH